MSDSYEKKISCFKTRNPLNRLNTKLFYLLGCELKLNLRRNSEKILSNKK